MRCCTIDCIQKIICKLIIAYSYILCEILKIYYKDEEFKVNLINMVEIFFVGIASQIDIILAFYEYSKCNSKFKYKSAMENETNVQLTKEEIAEGAIQIDDFFRKQAVIFKYLVEEEKKNEEKSQLKAVLGNIKKNVKIIEEILNN